MNWKNPKTINEKIYWLEAFTDTSLWTECSDKVKVRNFVKQRGLEQYLVPLYGVWKKAEEINWDKLPESFVLKCNHDCGSSIIVHDKSRINRQSIINFLNKRVNTVCGIQSLELHYSSIERRILAEELLKPKGFIDDDIHCSGMIDYKFWCLDGKARLVLVCYDRKIGGHPVIDNYSITPWEARRNMLAQDFRNQEFRDIPEPKNKETMVKIAETLAKGFPEVRIDLYNLDGRIYFGEMTFTSASGRMYYYSDEAQLWLGSKITLPNR